MKKWVYSMFKKEQDYTLPEDVPEGNGYVLCGYEIPDEILLAIFSHVPDVELIKRIPLVCQHWNFLTKNRQFWFTRLDERCTGISKETRQLLWKKLDQDGEMLSALQCMCLNKTLMRAFNCNLLKNPSGEEGLTHWKVQHRGDGIKVENPPCGSQPIPDSANLPTQHCFASSYRYSSRKQTVHLWNDYRVSQKLLQILKPTFVISEWLSARFDCSSKNKTRAFFIGPDGICARDEDWSDIDHGRMNWTKIEFEVEFEHMPNPLETLVFESCGKDNFFWAGFYGPKTAGSSIVMRI